MNKKEIIDLIEEKNFDFDDEDDDDFSMDIDVLLCFESEADVMRGMTLCEKHGYAGNFIQSPSGGICPILKYHPRLCECSEDMIKEMAKDLLENN